LLERIEKNLSAEEKHLILLERVKGIPTGWETIQGGVGLLDQTKVSDKNLLLLVSKLQSHQIFPLYQGEKIVFGGIDGYENISLSDLHAKIKRDFRSVHIPSMIYYLLPVPESNGEASSRGKPVTTADGVRHIVKNHGEDLCRSWFLFLESIGIKPWTSDKGKEKIGVAQIAGVDDLRLSLLASHALNSAVCSDEFH